MKFTSYDVGVILTSIMFLFNSFLAPITISSVLLFFLGYCLIWAILSLIQGSFTPSPYDAAVVLCCFSFGIVSIFIPLSSLSFVVYGFSHVAFKAAYNLIARSKS